MDTRKDYVDRIQAYYDRSDEKPRAKRILRELLQGHRYAKGLDVGAGPGELSEVLHEHCENLTLVEREEAFAEKLKAKFPLANVICGSLKDIPSWARFDLTLLSHVLYYQPPEDWAPIIRKLLAQSARLIVIQAADYGTWWETTQHFKPKLGPHSAFYSMALSELKKEIAAFSKLQILKAYSYQVSYSNLEDLVSYVGRSALAIHDRDALDRMLPEIREYCRVKFKAGMQPGFLTYDTEILILTAK